MRGIRAKQRVTSTTESFEEGVIWLFVEEGEVGLLMV
jgi:hypothetical protein